MRQTYTTPLLARLGRRYDRNCTECGNAVRGLTVRCPQCHALAFPQHLFIRLVFWIIVILLPALVYQVSK